MQKEDNWLKGKGELVERAQIAIKTGDYRTVLSCGQEIIALDEVDCDGLYMLAMANMHLGESKKSLDIINKIKKIDSGYTGAFIAEAYVYKQQGRIVAEIEVLQKTIQRLESAPEKETDSVRKTLGEAWSLLGSAYTLLGSSEEAVEAFLKSSSLEKEHTQKIKEYSNALFASNYIEGITKEKQRQLHDGYQQFFSNVVPYCHFVERREKIRIGYISPDFRQHPVAMFLYPLLANFSQEIFTVYCYSNNEPDWMTVQLQTFPIIWRDILGLDDDTAARLIYDDDIDILVDLSGHTKDNCLPILARRPGKIQVSGIGYFNTTGLGSVDYFLTDVYCDPVVEQKDVGFRERLLRLPHSHFCYVPLASMPDCLGAPVLKNKYITFGSFNNFNKVTDRILCLWLQILNQVPLARLVLKSSIFASEEGCQAVKNRLRKLGFDIQRIDLQGLSADYLFQYREIDIALDTFPYTGGMTTCEALYMGVPVVTLCGDRHGSRFGYSLMQNANLPEFIAENDEEYIEKAVKLANNKDLLDGLHKKLRQIIRSSSLMDVRQYVGEVEDAYIKIFEEYYFKQKYEEISSEKYELLRKVLDIYICQRDYHQATAVARRLLIGMPARDVMEKLACIYIETEQRDAAKRMVKQLQESFPENAYMLFLGARTDYLEDAWLESSRKAEQALKNSKDLTTEIRGMLHNLLGSCYKNLGDCVRSSREYLAASQHSLNRKGAAVEYSNYLFSLHYVHGLKPEKMYKAHCGYERFFADVKPYRHVRRDRMEKLKIGYISPDMRYHVVTFFSYTFFKNYDRSMFEVTCYAKCAEDPISQNIAAMVDHWCNISGMDDASVARQIYDDGIDILVDLSGHTRNNCLPILAYKPAPVQISGIGYFDTTGLPTVDYFLVDQYTDPVGCNDDYFCENLLRLNHSHFCYVPPDDMPPVPVAPCVRHGYITFASFNNFSKTTDEMLLLWKQILEKTKDSQLILKSRIFGRTEEREFVQARLQRLGFPLEQIDFRPETKNYLEEYRDVDIALDTYPYPGGGTTCEALYMGVPVVTLVGDRHGARFGYSLLKNVGLEELCAFSKKAYVDIAVSLAKDTNRLIEIHAVLREKMKRSPLMDGDLYMEEVEGAYLHIWQRFLEDEIGWEELISGMKLAIEENNWQKVIRYAQKARVFCELAGEDLLLLASAYYKTGDYRRSALILERALATESCDEAESYLLLAQTQMELLDYEAADKSFKRAHAVFSQSRLVNNRDVWGGLKIAWGFLQIILGEIADGMKSYRDVSEDRNQEIPVRCCSYSSYLLTLHYRENMGQFFYQEHCRYGDLLTGIRTFTHKKRPADKRIKIGYISPDFRQHVMFYFYHALLAGYDRQQFEVICYNRGEEDNFTKQLQTFVDGWCDIAFMKSYKEIADRIYADEVDILFDLAGHSANGCLPVFAYKPAPVQVSGLGYVDTTGLSTMDYLLTDIYVDPPGENDEFFTEKLLRLPKSQFCYTGRSDVPEPSAEAPCRSRGYITFASFNQYSKITDQMLRVWLKIMENVENSRLMLKSQVFQSSSALVAIRARFKRLGYDIERVDFLPTTDTYMEDYAKVDIALDTYPYPGGGTTCDALYMGVPVISLYGKRHGTRFGYSIMKNIGLEELAVQTEDEYVAKTVAMAGDWDLLDGLHARLRTMMLQSSLMDEDVYVRDMEAVYCDIWGKWQGE